MILGEYLKAATARPWAPGDHDCCMFPADWVREWGFGDPAAEWRGAYKTDAEALTLIERAGGIENLWARGLSSIGAAEVDEPREGDVGVIWALGENGPEHVGAIYVGPRWAMLTQRGLFFSRAGHVRVWGRP